VAADFVRIVIEDAQSPGTPESSRAGAPDGCRYEGPHGTERFCGSLADEENGAPVHAGPPAGTGRWQSIQFRWPQGAARQLITPFVRAERE
jgi:hypothetical protein